MEEEPANYAKLDAFIEADDYSHIVEDKGEDDPRKDSLYKWTIEEVTQ